MSLPMRNIISAYNVKNQKGAARWDADRLENNRLQRLSEIRAAVQSRRPPRPQVHSHAASRAASAGRRMSGRGRSASVPRSLSLQPGSEVNGNPGHPTSMKSRPAAGEFDPLFLLSPGSRERDAQQYVSSASEAAALKAEMQDWYFAPSTASRLQRSEQEPVATASRSQRSEQEPVPEPVEVWDVVKPSTAGEARRRSPYAIDLRHRPSSQSAGRPHSVPAGLATGHHSRSSVGSQVRRAEKAGKLTSRERLEVACESYGGPSVDMLLKASAEVGRRTPEAQVPFGEPAAAVAARSGNSPGLKSAQAINDWLAQAQQQVAALGLPSGAAQGQSKEESLSTGNKFSDAQE